LFRTPFVFNTAEDAVAFFNENRVDGVDPIPDEVLEFLGTVQDFDEDARFMFNVQPSLLTHYVAVACPRDHHATLYAKPGGVVFQVGDARNVRAIYEMWGEPQIELPQKLMDTDVWFAPEELFLDGELAPAVEFSLILAAKWAEWR